MPIIICTTMRAGTTARIAECGHNIVATVFVQSGAFYRADGQCPESMRPVGETEHMQSLAAVCAQARHAQAAQHQPTPLVAAAIVGTCDLRDPHVDRVLQAHMASPNFRGIRMVRRRQSPVPCGADDDAFRRGMRAMARHGLVYDVWQTSGAEHDCRSFFFFFFFFLGRWVGWWDWPGSLRM